MSLVDILRCEGPWPPEAASPAAHEGARHCPRVTRRHWSLSPDDDEDLEDTGDHRTLRAEDTLETGPRVIRPASRQYC